MMNRLAGFATALLFVAPMALAQPKPALVQDRDEPGRNPYQHTVIVTSDCSGQVNCQLDFPEVPSGMRLVLTQVAVEASVAVVADAIYVRVVNSGPTTRAAFTVTGPSNPRIATVPITMYQSAGSVPRVTVFGTTLAASVVVTLVGYLIVL